MTRGRSRISGQHLSGHGLAVALSRCSAGSVGKHSTSPIPRVPPNKFRRLSGIRRDSPQLLPCCLPGGVVQHIGVQLILHGNSARSGRLEAGAGVEPLGVGGEGLGLKLRDLFSGFQGAVGDRRHLGRAVIAGGVHLIGEFLGSLFLRHGGLIVGAGAQGCFNSELGGFQVGKGLCGRRGHFIPLRSGFHVGSQSGRYLIHRVASGVSLNQGIDCRRWTEGCRADYNRG